MTLKLDHTSIVVEDLAAAVDFFTTLGMAVAGRAPIEGGWVDRINGLEGIRVDIVMMRTPDGDGQLELTKFHHPALVAVEPEAAPPIAPGLRSIMFNVDKLDDCVERLRAIGATLVGEVAQYGDQYRLATCADRRTSSSRSPRNSRAARCAARALRACRAAR